MEIKHLDLVLLQLDRNDLTHALDYTGVFENENPELKNLTTFEKVLCLDKLSNDGFVNISYPFTTGKDGVKLYDNSHPLYHITYDGFLLIHQEEKRNEQPYTTYLDNIKKSERRDKLFKIVPIVIAIAAMITTAWTSIISTRSFNIGQRNYELQNRAYIKVQSIDKVWLDIAGQIKVNILTKNGGLTPAFGMGMSAAVEVNDSAFNNPAYPIPQIGNDSIYFLPNEIVPASITSDYLLTEKDDSLLRVGKKRLFVYGSILYKDILGKIRTANFFQMYNFHTKGFEGVSPYVNTSEN